LLSFNDPADTVNNNNQDIKHWRVVRVELLREGVAKREEGVVCVKRCAEWDKKVPKD
jgi:hypothetical protein